MTDKAKPDVFFRQPLWLLVTGYWIWLVWACAGDWIGTVDYNYGWFVPPLALYFLWKRMRPDGAVTSEELRVGSAEDLKPQTGLRGPSWLAWVFIVLSVLVIFPLELVRQAPMHWRFYPWMIGLFAFGNTMAVAWLTGGRERVRVFFVPSLFALTGIPWPTFLENAVAFPLMGVVTGWSAGALQLLGYPATVSGNVITLPNCTVGVEEACSGLRSLQTALMVGLAAGELKQFGPVRRIAILLIAFVLALLGNQVRVLMLAMAGIQGGSAAVAGMHDLAGYAVLGILLGGVALAAAVMGKLGGRGVASEELRGGTKGLRDERTARGRRPETGDQISEVRIQMSEARRVNFAGAVLLGAAVVAMLAAHAWYWSARGEASRPVAAILEPQTDGGFVVDKNVPAAVLEMMRPDDYSYIRAERNGRPAELVGYHFYWRPDRGNARQMYHRPDACMPGAGWRIDGEVTQETLRIGDREVVFNVFPFRNPGGRSLIYWAAYLNGQPVELDFQSDLHLATAKLWDFVRKGVSQHSYEVAAFLRPDDARANPDAPAVDVFANRVFQEAVEEGRKD